MIYIRRRILETLICHVVVSVVFASLFYFGILQPGYKLSVFMLGLAGVIDLGLVIFFSSIYYKFTEEDTPTFYKTNLLAVLSLVAPVNLFAVIDSAVSLEPVYTFLFFPFKLGMIAFGMSKVVSALIFSLILLVIAIINPLFLRKVLPPEEPMPPMLETDDNEKNK